MWLWTIFLNLLKNACSLGLVSINPKPNSNHWHQIMQIINKLFNNILRWLIKFVTDLKIGHIHQLENSQSQTYIYMYQYPNLTIICAVFRQPNLWCRKTSRCRTEDQKQTNHHHRCWSYGQNQQDRVWKYCDLAIQGFLHSCGRFHLIDRYSGSTSTGLL